MTDTTPRYRLPLLSAGQAQKELLHNEAISALNFLASACVQAAGVSVPPADPAIGDAWIVGTDPTGEWDGQDGALAAWSDNGWRFYDAPEGLAVWRKDHGRWIIRHSGAWDDAALPAQAIAIDGTVVLRSQGAAVPDPTGGATIDTEARSALSAILARLRSHGMIAS